MWTKGGDIELPDNPIAVVVVIVFLLLVIFWIFQTDMEISKKNNHDANKIINSKDTRICILENDFVVPYASFATGVEMKFIIKSESFVRKLNDKSLVVFQEKLPNEIQVRYGTDNIDNGFGVVLNNVTSLKVTNEKIKSAKFDVIKK